MGTRVTSAFYESTWAYRHSRSLAGYVRLVEGARLERHLLRVLPPPEVHWNRDDVPPCWPGTLRDWQLWFDASVDARESTSPCSICRRERHTEMLNAGRCSNPDWRPRKAG
jgi:hypothetical protein